MSYKPTKVNSFAYREMPVDGQVDGFPETEQVYETPQRRGHEGGHHHEEEPVRAICPSRGCACHTQDTEELQQ